MCNCVNRNKNVQTKNKKNHNNDNNNQKTFKFFLKHFNIIKNAKQHVSQKKSFEKKQKKNISKISKIDLNHKLNIIYCFFIRFN